MNSSKHVSMILDLAYTSGLKLTHIGREVGVAQQSISNWKMQVKQPTEENVDKLFSTLSKRANFLASIDLTKTTLDYVNDELGVAYTSIAKEVGMTKQDLDQKLDRSPDLSEYPEIRDRIEDYLHTIGKNLLKGLRPTKKSPRSS